MWPICGGGVDFSSQAGLRKVTLSENILVVHVCGHCRPEELWLKIGPDVLHQGLLWSFKNVEEIVIFTLGLLCLFLYVRFAFSIYSSSQSVVSHSLHCLCCFFGYGHVSVSLLFFSFRHHCPILYANFWLLWNPICIVVAERWTVYIEFSSVSLLAAGTVGRDAVLLCI